MITVILDPAIYQYWVSRGSRTDGMGIYDVYNQDPNFEVKCRQTSQSDEDGQGWPDDQAVS